MVYYPFLNVDIESLPTTWETLLNSDKYLVRFWIRSCLKLFGTGFFKRGQKILGIFLTFSTFYKDVFFSPTFKKWLTICRKLSSEPQYIVNHSLGAIANVMSSVLWGPFRRWNWTLSSELPATSGQTQSHSVYYTARLISDGGKNIPPF